jgi:hypothetical protein
MSTADKDQVTAVTIDDVVRLVALNIPAELKAANLWPQYHNPAAKICCVPWITHAL